MEIEINKYNDVWFDNGIINFFNMLKSLDNEYEENEKLFDKLTIDSFGIFYSISEDNLQRFLDLFSREILKRLRPSIIIKGKDKKGIDKEFKKDFVLIQEKSKIHGKVELKEKIFHKSEILKTLKEIYINLDVGDKKCSICGRSFKDSVKKLQQASYPFVTKMRSLSGIRSGSDINLKEYETEYCPQCYLIGILEWLDNSFVYNVMFNKKKSILIFPYHDDLKKLHKIKKILGNNILNNTSRYSNIRREYGKNDLLFPEGKYATFISFFEMFLENATSIQNAQDLNNWYIMESGLGKVKNPKLFKLVIRPLTISLIKNILRNYHVRFYRDFISMFYAFKKKSKSGDSRDFDMEKELRESLCEAFVVDDFDEFTQCFVPSKGIVRKLSKEAHEGLEKIILEWRFKRMSEEEKKHLLEVLKNGGEYLAKIIGDRLSLFFKFEKAKSKTEVLEVLEEIMRRLAVDKGRFETNYNTWKELESSKKKVVAYINKRWLEETVDLIVQKGDDKKFLSDVKNILLIYTSLNIKSKTGNKEDANGNE